MFSNKKYFLFNFLIFFLILFTSLFIKSSFSTVNAAVNAAELTCGSGRYWEIQACDPNTCQPIERDKINRTEVCVNRNGSCVWDYLWTGCYWEKFPTGSATAIPKCVLERNLVENLPCGTAPSSTTANNYNYTKCPAGTSLSCGSATEAEEQNKTACLYKKTCNEYFFPSSIGAGCGKNSPITATCSWNCSCCPTGTKRTCTEGTTYTKNITVDLTNSPAGAVESAKVLCNTHDDIFIKNTLIRTYTNPSGDKLQDWRLSCRVNVCKCSGATSPTPTPLPLKCEQMLEFVGPINVTNDLGSIKLKDEVRFKASVKNTGRTVVNMTFQLIKDGKVVENKIVPATLVNGQWVSNYRKVIDSYGNYRVRVVRVTSK